MAHPLDQYVYSNDDNEHYGIDVKEGAYRGWVPRAIYSMNLREVRLPFLRLISFPVGGTALGSLAQSMTIFEAVGNYLTRLPLSFTDCQNLTKLDFSFNHFPDIPFPVYQLIRLEELRLSHNDVEIVDPAIGQLRNLRILDLSGNLLTELPNELRRCGKIQELYLSGKFYPRGRLTKFPECICQLKHLVYLDLSWQQIGDIPDSFGNLRKLRELNLKWNQLRFVSKELKKCAKLQVIDLSGALRLLSAIPEPLFYLEDLCKLFLSDNFFTDIPKDVCSLVMLRSLQLQRNSLLRLSEDTYRLRYLESLDLSENLMKSIPNGIKNLKRLQHLALDSNELTELPDEICCLEHLEYLSVGNNKLTKLPEKIHELYKLACLNADNNYLEEIPLLMDRLERLEARDGLSLLNNPLRSPYKEIMEQGTQALFTFLKGIRLKEAHHRWKMILIGAAKAGKTSLRRALMYGRANLTEESERTWVMERHLWEPESRLRVQVLDFGGHHIYQAAHHMFLSSDALHVVVFDFTKYSTELYEELIGHWLEAIMDKAAGAQILLVGTHCDLCTKEDIDEKNEDILRLIRKIEDNKRMQIEHEIQRITEELDRPESKEVSGGIPEISVGRLTDKRNWLQKLLHSRSKIPKVIHVVSCADNLFGVADLKSVLIDRFKSSTITSLPALWCRFLEEIQRIPDKVLLFDRALSIFKEILEEDGSMGMGGSPHKTLEMVLKYLHSTGEIVWYGENEALKSTVFHHPETLIDMLRSVFRHDFDEVVYYRKDIGETIALRESQFDKMKKDFLARGLLTKELLRFLLIHFKLSQDAPESFVSLVISLMLKFSLCFELRQTATNALMGSSQIVQFPWFFPQEVPEHLETLWPSKLPSNTFQLTMEIHFYGSGPPNFFEKLSVKLHSFLSTTDRLNWKDGVLAEKNRSQLLVRREHWDNGTVVVVMARGQSDLQELWTMVQDVRGSATQLIKDWPLLECELYLVCLHCLLKDCEEPHRYPGHVLEYSIPNGVYTMKSCDKFPDDDVPTCFVFALEEANLQENHQRYMEAATDFMRCHLADRDEVDGRGPSVLSDGGLAFVASRLGLNWNLVAIQLGLSQPRIEQIVMSYPQDAYQQILHALLEWRDMTSDHCSSTQKVEALYRVLSSDGIDLNDLVQTLQRDYTS